MSILIDQCVNKDTIEKLKEKGFETVRLSEINMSNASDREIFDYALNNKHVLFTFDKDFGNVLRFDIKASSGVVIIYIEDMTKEEIVKSTVNFFEKFNPAQLEGNLFIVEKNRIRIWPK